MAEAAARAALVLVATPIGNLGDLSPRAVVELQDADVIAAEDTRRTRQLLTHAGIAARSRLRAVHAHNEAQAAAAIVAEISAGARVVYVSDAGMPGVSDPGERLVRACVDAGLRVDSVPGPSALLAALTLSGLPTVPFQFVGFLERKGRRRSEMLAAIAAYPGTTVVFESPRRVSQTLADLGAACGQERPAAVARELTKLHEEVLRGTLATLAAGSGDEGWRGEFVIVVGPPAREPAASDDAIEHAVAAALAAGATTRDAVAGAAASLGTSRRRAYEIALRLAATRTP